MSDSSDAFKPGMMPQRLAPEWLDDAPLPIFVVRESQPSIVGLNRRAAEIFASPPARDIEARHIFDDPRQLDEVVSRIRGQSSISDFGVRLRTREGAQFWTALTGCKAFYDGAAAFVIIPWPLRPADLPAAGAPHDFAFWKAVFDYAGVGITVLDRNLKPTMINRFARDLFGFDEEDHRAIGIERVIHPEDWPETEDQWGQLLRGEIDAFRAEKRYLRRDRRIFWGDVSVTSIRDQSGKPRHFLAFVIDITARRRVEERLKRANSKLVRQLQRIRALKEQMQELALHDPLTGLYNRRHMQDTLVRELARSKREHQSLSLVMMDIDHFKTLNDQHGHPAGDKMLVALAEILLGGMRMADVSCRIGGEEFLAILPGAPIEAAAQRAEQWRSAFENVRITHENGELKTTLSLGIAAFPQHGKDAEQLIAQVDGALYAAKRSGRNRIIVQP